MAPECSLSSKAMCTLSAALMLVRAEVPKLRKLFSFDESAQRLIESFGESKLGSSEGSIKS
eukprot:2094177-Alexandrium_andersonii.AAC.1